jgi:hypothetical protein
MRTARRLPTRALASGRVVDPRQVSSSAPPAVDQPGWK